MVGTAWNKVGTGYERSQSKFLDQFGGVGCPPNLAQGCLKTAQISPKCPKWRFEGSGGPKRLEQRGMKMEWAMGGPI